MSPAAECDKPAGGSTADLDAFWLKITVGWHIVYLGLLALVALLAATENDLSSAERTRSLVAVAVMAVVYVLVGRRILAHADQAQLWQRLPQLVVSWAGFYVLIDAGLINAYMLLFALIPHLWVFLATRWAVVGTFVSSGGIAAVEVRRAGWSADSLQDTLPSFALQAGLSLLLGLFMTSVFTQAERRAALIDELERTRAELAETEHARGVLAERERLSREIHDTLAQGFTSVLTLAQAIEATLDRDPAAARERLALLQSTARENLAEARALVNALAPAGLRDASLPEALKRVADRFARETGVEVDVQIDGTVASLPASTEVVLLRTAQEALANVGKHANACTALVALRFGADGSAALVVTDDGRGFDVAGDSGAGFGLRSMRSRVEQVGGALEISSTPGTGTSVTATVP